MPCYCRAPETELRASTPAISRSYYGGECTADAVVQCLMGQSPAGRLPTSWPRCLEEASSEVARKQKVEEPGGSPQVNSRRLASRGTVQYFEGLHLGYRNGDLHPAFAFGHGLLGSKRL